MVACARYWLALLLRSQRFFPPLVLLVIGVVVLTANDTGPLVGAYGACAAVLFPAALWMTVALLGADDTVQRSVTVVNAGGSGRVLCAGVLVAVGVGLVGVLFGLAFPALSGDHDVTAGGICAGAVVQLCALLTGVAAGLLCSRLVVRHQVTSLVAALGLALIAYLVPWLSPLHTALRVSDRHEAPADLLAPLLGLATVAAVLVVLAAGVTQVVSARRD